MSEYSIYVENGKVVGDSGFFLWERVELEERIGGLQFAMVCLDEAWQRRGEVTA